MNDTPERTSRPAPEMTFRSAMIWLTLIVIGYLAFRIPIMLHEPGRLDEHYAVPGWSITKTGLPQLPHLPSRNPDSMFYKADKILYAEPPLHFYAEALCFLLLPDTIGTARLPSLLSGLGILVLLYLLTRAWTGSRTAGLWGTAIFSVSRWFIYGVTLARGDILCTFFGLAALWTTLRWTGQRKLRWLICTGVLIGLGGLTHPFAVVYAVQIGIWVILESRGWLRWRDFGIVTLVSLLTFALWIPLILVDPEVFRIQFRNQFLDMPTSETLEWLRSPLGSLRYHGVWMWLNIGPWQCVLGGLWLLISTITGLAWRERGRLISCVLAWSGFLMIALISGTHHDIPGYWSYPGALMFVSVGWGLGGIFEALTTSSPRVRWIAWPAGVLLLATMIPGSSARILVSLLRHWNDVNYNAPAFAQRLIREIPPDARCMVDGEFVLDFLAAGRPTLGIPTLLIYLDAENHPYDYLVVSRSGAQYRVGEAYCGKLKRTEGIHDAPFACYAEVYVPTDVPCTPHPPEGMR